MNDTETVFPPLLNKKQQKYLDLKVRFKVIKNILSILGDYIQNICLVSLFIGTTKVCIGLGIVMVFLCYLS